MNEVLTCPRVCRVHAKILHDAEPGYMGPDDAMYYPRHINMTVIGFNVNCELSEQFYERSKAFTCDVCYGRTTENDILREQGFM